MTALERTETPLNAPGVVQPDPHGNHCTLPHLKLPRNPKIYISGYDSGRIQTCIVAHYSATQTLSRTRGLRASPTLTFRLVKSLRPRTPSVTTKAQQSRERHWAASAPSIKVEVPSRGVPRAAIGYGPVPTHRNCYLYHDKLSRNRLMGQVDAQRMRVEVGGCGTNRHCLRRSRSPRGQGLLLALAQWPTTTRTSQQ